MIGRQAARERVTKLSEFARTVRQRAEDHLALVDSERQSCLVLVDCESDVFGKFVVAGVFEPAGQARDGACGKIDTRDDHDAFRIPVV